MLRVSLKCANCGNQDLEVEVNYCIPRAISLVCNKPGCGRVTPIAFFDEKGRAYEINGEASMQVYEDSFCGDISRSKAEYAIKKDRMEKCEKIE